MFCLCNWTDHWGDNLNMSIFSNITDKIFGTSHDNSIQEMPQFIPTPPTELPNFSEPHIQLIERNHQVESKDDMIKFIDDADLSCSCKQCFKNIVLNVYDRNVIFADNSQTNGVEIAYIESMLDIYPQIWTTATKNDRIKPVFLQILNDIKMQLRIRLTRTTGVDRERIIATKNVNTNEIKVTRPERR